MEYHHLPSGKLLRAAYEMMPDGEPGWSYELIDKHVAVISLSLAEYKVLLALTKEGGE